MSTIYPPVPPNLSLVQRLQLQEYIYPLTEAIIFDTWGAVVLGAMFACLLQGYVFSMATWYFRQYASKDHWVIRSTIVLILMTTTTETCLVMSKSIKQTLRHPLDLLYVINLASRPDEWLLAPIASISISICQAFLCWRCLRFARAMQNAYARWVRPTTLALAAVMILLFACSFVGIIMLPIRLSQATNLIEALLPSSSPAQLSFWFYYTFTIFVILDIVIVVATTIQHRAARTGFVESNTILDVIVNLTLRNGAVILAAQTAQLVLFHTSSSSAWLLFPHAFLSRIYAITVLTTLILPRTAQREYRQRQADQEEAMHKDGTIMHNRPSASGLGAVRSSMSGSQDPSSASTRCTACGSCSLAQFGSKGKMGYGTPRLGYRSAGSTNIAGSTIGVGELGVTIHPREKVFAETEGPVSFVAALFGLNEEGSESKGSPEIGVDTNGSGGWAIGPDMDLGAEWDEKAEEGTLDSRDEKVDIPVEQTAGVLPVLKSTLPRL